MVVQGIEEFKVGMSSSYTRTIVEKDIIEFAHLTKDNNPVHTNNEYASKSIFKKQVVHGMFTASFFSKIFGTQFPGPGCIYLSQSIVFKKPVFIGDEVEASVTIDAVDTERSRLTFMTLCKVKGHIVTEGFAEILIPRELTE